MPPTGSHAYWRTHLTLDIAKVLGLARDDDSLKAAYAANPTSLLFVYIYSICSDLATSTQSVITVKITFDTLLSHAA